MHIKGIMQFEPGSVATKTLQFTKTDYSPSRKGSFDQLVDQLVIYILYKKQKLVLFVIVV